MIGFRGRGAYLLSSAFVIGALATIGHPLALPALALPAGAWLVRRSRAAAGVLAIVFLAWLAWLSPGESARSGLLPALADRRWWLILGVSGVLLSSAAAWVEHALAPAAEAKAPTPAPSEPGA